MRRHTFFHVHPVKIQVFLQIWAVRLESLLYTWRNFGSLVIQNMSSKDSNQTAQMSRLIWIFPGHMSKGSYDGHYKKRPIMGIGALSCEAVFSDLVLPPFWTGFYSKRKEFSPIGSKFFPFRVDPISEGIGVLESKQESQKHSGR